MPRPGVWPTSGERPTKPRAGVKPFKELSFAQVRQLLEEDDRYLGIDLDAELPLWRAEAESLDKPTFAYVIGTNKFPLLRWEDDL